MTNLCVRCNKPADKEFSVPADNQSVRHLCVRHDAAVNRAALEAMFLPNVEELMIEYGKPVKESVKDTTVRFLKEFETPDYSALKWDELKKLAKKRLPAIPRKRVNVEKALVELDAAPNA